MPICLLKIHYIDMKVIWPLVMKAIREIPYNGWLTVEQGLGGDTPEGVKEHFDRLTAVMGSGS